MVTLYIQEACAALGLLKDDNEWHEAMKENEMVASAYQLRDLFVHMIVNCQITDVYKLWISHWECMSDDVLHKQRLLTKNPALRLTEEQIQNFTLAGIIYI